MFTSGKETLDCCVWIGSAVWDSVAVVAKEVACGATVGFSITGVSSASASANPCCPASSGGFPVPGAIAGTTCANRPETSNRSVATGTAEFAVLGTLSTVGGTSGGGKFPANPTANPVGAVSVAES